MSMVKTHLLPCAQILFHACTHGHTVEPCLCALKWTQYAYFIGGMVSHLLINICSFHFLMIHHNSKIV